MASETVTPAGITDAAAKASLDMSRRIYDLGALLSCIGYQLQDVHDSIDPKGNSTEVDRLWQTLRAIRHCEALAGQIATDVEGAPYV